MWPFFLPSCGTGATGGLSASASHDTLAKTQADELPGPNALEVWWDEFSAATKYGHTQAPRPFASIIGAAQ